jgi:hypothetical protein
VLQRIKQSLNAAMLPLGGTLTFMLALSLLGLSAPSVSPATAAESNVIECQSGANAKKTTEAIEKAIEKGGTYVLECFEYNEIAAPKPKEAPTTAISEGFKVESGDNVTFVALAGTLPTFENEKNSHSRLFTIAKGGSLTLEGVALSVTTFGTSGVSAGKAKLTGETGEEGEEGQEEEKESASKKEGTEGVPGREANPESSEDGSVGTAGGSGGIIASLSGNAPLVQGGAIKNAGTLTLHYDDFQGDYLVGGAGGKGGSGGNGGKGGQGGFGGKGVAAKCGKETQVGYLRNPGNGGEGATGGDGGAGTPAGNGGEAQGGAIYNTGTVNARLTNFDDDQAEGGYGGEGGAGGKGGNGGEGGGGKEGGDGKEGGNGEPGGAAGSGASGYGGSIYNAGGALTLEESSFEEDNTQGGESGPGGQGGDGGKGGGGGSSLGYSECEGENAKSHENQTNANGADGGSGAPGGKGGNGGSGEGGAIYTTNAIALVGLNTVFENKVSEGAAAVGSCEEAFPCAGKGGEAGDGGSAGVGGKDPGDAGKSGPESGANGAAGVKGVALDPDLHGATNGGEFVTEKRRIEAEIPSVFELPINSPPTSSTGTGSSKASGGGGSGGGDDGDDKGQDTDEPTDNDTSKPTTKQSGSTVKVETGETVNCPAGGQDCTAEVTVTISEEMPAADASSKHKAPKPKILTIGHGRIVVAPGHSAKVVVTLSSEGLALLHKDHHLSAHVTTIVTEPGLVPVKRTATIPIAQPKPAKHGKKR